LLLLLGAGLVLVASDSALPRLWPKAGLAAGLPTSVAVYDARGGLLRLTLAADERYRMWTPLDRISPALLEAVLLYEDRHFYAHPGVDPLALVRGAWRSLVGGGRRLGLRGSTAGAPADPRGRRLGLRGSTAGAPADPRGRRYGGSTITMQLARRLSGARTSSLLGKLAQIGRALALERLYTKREILEAYVNLCPAGGNVEGFPAASWIYFGKPPDRLLLGEALALAVIPQNPTRRRPSSEAASPELRRARAALLETWRAAHPTRARDAELARLPLALRPSRSLPFAAPHFVEDVLARRSPGQREIRTTLDPRLQALLERQVRATLARSRSIGVENAAAILVEHRGLEVRALLGSADFADAAIEGQVDGTRARRSPASTIKPFIYALALEQGLIHPLTLLKDAPTAYGGFHPENYDRTFVGPIPAQDALVRSRNVPAIDLAARLRPGLYALLERAGIPGLRSEAHYGLSLALGGAELTLRELVELYAMLARGGVLRPLRTEEAGASSRTGRRLLSAEAAFVTLEMLATNPRPGGPTIGAAARGPVIAYKTGTSQGLRDAWTVGVVGPYVLGVWVGRFSGEGDAAFVGGRVAAPLFFEVADALAASVRFSAAAPWRRPARVDRALVCATSGQLPTERCPKRRTTWFLPGRSPIEPCTVHRQVVVDARTGLQACPPHAGPIRTEVYEFWPSDLLALFQLAGLPRRAPPAPGPSCPLSTTAARGQPPRIRSPASRVTYALTGGERIAFVATTDADARELYWFVDDSFVGRVRSDQPLFWKPRAGRFVVRAVDDAGRGDARVLEVEEAPPPREAPDSAAAPGTHLTHR
jgi:penicillin-binding protein 1C